MCWLPLSANLKWSKRIWWKKEPSWLMWALIVWKTQAGRRCRFWWSRVQSIIYHTGARRRGSDDDCHADEEHFWCSYGWHWKMNIDIIVTTYKRYGLLQETLRSVANQSYPHWRCWIAEDGESKETYEAVKPFLQDSRYLSARSACRFSCCSPQSWYSTGKRSLHRVAGWWWSLAAP